MVDRAVSGEDPAGVVVGLVGWRGFGDWGW